MQLERAINECRREYNILIDAIMNSQKGILPHIITPAQILRQMKANQADIPIPPSATCQNLIVNIIDFDVFIRDNLLVYVIRLPLTDHVNYNVYHVLPLPIKIKDAETRFTFILPEREYLLMDVAKQYYVRLKADEIKECKLISSYHTVCKQNNPVVEYVRACEPRTTSYTPLCLDLAPIKRSRPINILQREATA
jgi:hypothetical protein